ncbi:MAG: hypothetical protein K2J71_06545, partial [Oscillospiraceae bacterium]|nr:hypothetical protein [Oscillospiraceae bacterium]
MTDKKLLEFKIRMQKIRNILKNSDGLQVLEISEIPFDFRILEKSGYYADHKMPDSKIPMDSQTPALYAWIIQCLQLEDGKILFLLLDSFPIKVKIIHTEIAVKNLWQAREITILDAQQTVLSEICCDSRDEQH